MAISNNNVKNFQFLRNQNPYNSREAANDALQTAKADALDGSALIARYSGYTETEPSTFYVKTLVGYVAEVSGDKYITIFDIDDAGSDVIKYINSLVGSGVTSANTVTSQLETLSGATFSPGTSSSADTSVEGAKAYAYDLMGTRDYSGISTSDAAVVVNVEQSDGFVSASQENVGNLKLTDYTKGSDSGSVAATDSINQAVAKLENQIDAEKNAREEAVSAETAARIAAIEALDKDAEAVDGQVVTTVSEVDGVVSETKANVKDLQLGGYAKTNDTGDILSADTINVALSKLENKAAAITINDEDGSINVTPVTSGTDISVNIKTGEHVIAKDGGAGIYTDLDLIKITGDTLPATVKERYQLLATDDSQIGVNIDIAKDSHIVSITYISDPADAHYQNLEYVYIDASGDTKTEYVDVSSLVLEAEFASGVTVTNHIAHGVVDPASESFLTVGADGFKLSGVQDAIDTAVSGLDASVSAETSHIEIKIDEVDGKLTAVTLSEDDIASASDLAELSGQTVSGIVSNNASITAQINDAAGNKQYNIETDASKIKMSGFTADASGFTAITEDTSVKDAVKAIETEIIANEQTTAAALTDLDSRLDVVESGYVETVKVNNVALAETDNTVNVQISSSAATGTETATIIVNTDANGAVTLTIDTLDAGYYE
jgi:hypothetical protein